MCFPLRRKKGGFSDLLDEAVIKKGGKINRLKEQTDLSFFLRLLPLREKRAAEIGRDWVRWELVFSRLLSETDRWHRQAEDQ